MSKEALGQSRFEAVEAYLLGTMSAADRTSFELELGADGELQTEVQLQRENMLAVEMGGMRQTLGAIMAEDRERSSVTWPHYLKYAAAAAVLLIGALWWLTRPSLNERLYAEYHQADPGLPVPMSATRDPEFQDAMVAYKMGQYKEASSKWGKILAAAPGNDTLAYYIASAHLSAGDAAGAIPLFKIVGNSPSSVFRDKANWYLFLSYLHEGRFAEMRAMRLDQDSTYGERAAGILGKIGK